MENLLESNERTLVLFDSVCTGLSECLLLVHADIKQMTEHRNKLAQLEQEHIQAKLIPTQELEANVTDPNSINYVQGETGKGKRRGREATETGNNNDDDPHHLAGLKLLDKRLADSFSQAFSLNDLQKSSIVAKQQAQRSRPSIFQVLLGKTNKNNGGQLDGLKKKDSKNSENTKAIDNKTIIDDINRQTRLAMQYSKQLEAHLFKVEDLRSKYEMHLKMGLVVRSVASAYIGNGSSNSLAARRHHCSSLVINDSASNGTCRSSLSSLNLSTWSSSRSKAHKRRAAAAATITASTNSHFESNNNNNNNNNNNQMFVSTISLNNKHNKRLNLAKLISSPSASSAISANKNQYDSYYADPQTLTNSRHRVSSHQSIVEPACGAMSNYGALYAPVDQWAVAPTESPYADNKFTNNETISKSIGNLSHTSAKALSRSASKNQGSTSASKTTIKEFIENIDKIESEFESYMGSFLLAIEDIQGFARVCQGDVFEITIKYGNAQKFKTRISVLKDNGQKCDNRQVVFKARIADVLAIKAYECKGLGKRILLGHKLCETRDLFTARSQLMTISLNQTGSIKLNLIVTWNPLHLTPSSTSSLPGVDISHISLPPTPVSSSTLSSLSSVPSLTGATTTINIQSRNRNKINESPPAGVIERQQHHESMYQTVDPTYGYYIPPPDYLTNEQKY